MSETRVLIAEDELLVAKGTAAVLEGMGYEVVAVVRTGDEAISQARRTRPDFAVIDVILEGEPDGIDTAERIKAECNCEVIYVTAYSDAALFDRAKSTEPAGYLIKPVSPHDLRRTIEIALHKRRTGRRLTHTEERFDAAMKAEGGSAQVTARAAHSLNNTLQLLMGEVRIAMKRLDRGNLADVRTSLENILRTTQVASQSLGRMRRSAADASEASSTSVFDCARTVREALKMCREWLNEKARRGEARVEMVESTASGCLVEGYEHELYASVVTLIKDAAAALPEGGTIRVTVDADPDCVRIGVHDEGTPLVRRNIPLTADPEALTNLGDSRAANLLRCREHVAGCSGSLVVESEQGRGTTVQVSIPRADALRAPHDGPGLACMHVRRSVLVIDDLEPIVAMVHNVLSDYDQTVVTACSGYEGLERFQANPADVVICDLAMPGMNGWTVGKRIKEYCAQRGIRKPSFIILTGWGDQSHRTREIAESGVDAVIEKPFDVQALFHLMHDLEKARPTNENLPA